MQGAGFGKAMAKTMAYVGAMPARGALQGALDTFSNRGKLGAGIGWLAGKAVRPFINGGTRLLNKTLLRNHKLDTTTLNRRTVKCCQLAGAFATNYVFNKLNPIAYPLSIGAGAIGNTLKAVCSAKTVFKEYRDYNHSETLQENLFDPFHSIFEEIYRGDAMGTNTPKLKARIKDRHNQVRFNLRQKKHELDEKAATRKRELEAREAMMDQRFPTAVRNQEQPQLSKEEKLELKAKKQAYLSEVGMAKKDDDFKTGFQPDQPTGIQEQKSSMETSGSSAVNRMLNTFSPTQSVVAPTQLIMV